MKRYKAKGLLMIMMVLMLLIASGSTIFGSMSAFLVKAEDGRYYEFNRDELNSSYTMFQINPSSAAADLYKQFAGIGGGKVVAFKDSLKGWMDFAAAQTASLKAQIEKVPFNIDAFSATPEAPVYPDSVSDIIVVTPGMDLLEVGVKYQSFVDKMNWMDFVNNGEMAGTIGQNLDTEAIKIQLVNPPAEGKIKYRVYNNGLDWQEYESDGSIAGTDVLGNNLEAIEIFLENMPGYSVEYQVKIIEEDEWQPWVSDGAMAGTNGKNLAIEAIRIRIVKVTP